MHPQNDCLKPIPVAMNRECLLRTAHPLDWCGRMVAMPDGTSDRSFFFICVTSTRIIHKCFYCDRRYAAATSLRAQGPARRRAGSPLGRSTYCFKYASLPRASTRPSRLAFQRSRHEPSWIMRVNNGSPGIHRAAQSQRRRDDGLRQCERSTSLTERMCFPRLMASSTLAGSEASRPKISRALPPRSSRAHCIRAMLTL